VKQRAPRALLLRGGWEGHQPGPAAAIARDRVLRGFEVTETDDLGVLNRDTLNAFDLFVPVWTFGELPDGAEAAVLRAVEHGLGLVAWHGFTSSFLASRALKHLVGGQFVAHPGGENVTYDVAFLDNDPLVAGLAPLRITSEQYYMLVDPAVTVLATTTVGGGPMLWLAGVKMPVAWRRGWGAGRVAYCSLGHTPEVLALPQVSTLLRRAALWAARSAAVPQIEGEASSTLNVPAAGVARSS